MKRVLVTGGSGFLGRAIVRELIRTGRSVRSFQRHGTPVEGETIIGDVRDGEAVAAAMQGVDAVIHAAGLAHVFGNTAVAAFADINERGTDTVARAAVAAGVQDVVHVSSVAVYGGGSDDGAEESRCRPVGGYAISKAAAEQRVRDAVQGSATRVTILRLATLYGEGDRGNVQRLLQLIDRGRFVWIGTGTNRKTLLHVEDAGRACVQPLLSGGDGVETYNVGGAPVPMRDIVEELGRALGRPLPRWRVPAPLASGAVAALSLVTPSLGRSLTKWMSDEVYAAARFQRRFGFSPNVSLGEGLRRQVAWWRRGRDEAGQQ